MRATLKPLIKRTLPEGVLTWVRKLRNRRYNALTIEQVFTEIYTSGAWGRSDDPERPFYSGSGSRRIEETGRYVDAVAAFLASMDRKPDVVDLGCGDFSVGQMIRPHCDGYTACDVVPALIQHNRTRFADLDVDFRTLDLTREALPPGDVAFVRQVLQHLSNEDIQRFVWRAPSVYRYLIVTEHLPSRPGFSPNKDKPAGPGTRMGYDSGVVLTSHPFNLRPKAQRRLCEVESVDTGVLVTTLYET